jgi:hypothetical protein
MRRPKLRLPIGKRAEFEKRLFLWTVMRDVFGGWEGLASYLEIGKIHGKTRRIRKKRVKVYMTRLVLRDLADTTGLTWGPEVV